MKDILGNEIRVGDIVAYPRRQGSFTWNATLRVTAGSPYTLAGIEVSNENNYVENPRKVKLTRPDRAVRVAEPVAEAATPVVRTRLNGQELILNPGYAYFGIWKGEDFITGFHVIFGTNRPHVFFPRGTVISEGYEGIKVDLNG